uniref:Putrescine-binding periplasmic protein n=1 Tax=Anthurium amnicola TaxID=1678845 RepID=A0A1D1XD17_9ARAE
MALFLAAAHLPAPPPTRCPARRHHDPHHLRVENPNCPPSRWPLRASIASRLRSSSGGTLPASAPAALVQQEEKWWSLLLLHLAAPALLFLVSWGATGVPIARAWTARPRPLPVKAPVAASEDQLAEDSDVATKDEDDAEWKREFERWKSKTYALTVPLRIVALRGSLPPAWIKDFAQVQGKRLRLVPEFRRSLESIFSDLSTTSRTGQLEPKSAMAADVVSIGDSWLNYAIREGLVEPLQGAEGQDWFRNLSNKWKVYLCRNNKGEIDPRGIVWAAPYRWGCMVIAYKKNKFVKHNLAPIEDWDDLWRPELRGKIVMVDSPREVIGAVLKSLGASYNTKDIELLVGGMSAVMQKLTTFQGQVRLFDSGHYLKAFGTADAWVAVGWSCDVLPVAKRMSNVSVIAPKSGASLWADLWAIPATKRFLTSKLGGRIRGPSPLIHQWMEFCLQEARAAPYQQGAIPGASPAALESPSSHGSQEISKGKPKLDTNLIAGVPPPEILKKCEFLEPLSDKALSDYQLLITSMQKSGHRWIRSAQDYFFSLVEKVGISSFFQ